MSDTIQLKSEYEGAQTHSTDPVVAVRNNVISPIECAYLIELAKPHIKRAGVVLDEGYQPSEGRTGSNHWLKYDEDDVVQSIGQRIADIVAYRWQTPNPCRLFTTVPNKNTAPTSTRSTSVSLGVSAQRNGGDSVW